MCSASSGPNSSFSRRPDELRPFTVSFRLESGKHAGITLRNVASGPGVRVDAVKRRDAAYRAGVREGDVLIWLNGQPCRGHHEVVELIDKAKGSNSATLNFVLLPRPQGAPPIAPRPDRTERAAAAAAASGPASPVEAGGGSGSEAGGSAGASAVASPVAPTGGGAAAAAAAAVAPSPPTSGGVPGFMTVVRGEARFEETSPSVIVYSITFADADGEWTVSRRYSQWRKLFDKLQSFWPRALVEPAALAFPPKALPSFLLKSSPGFVTERAAMLGRFVRGVLEAARLDDESGLRDWLQYWLRAESRRLAATAAAAAEAAPAAAAIEQEQESPAAGGAAEAAIETTESIDETREGSERRVDAG